NNFELNKFETNKACSDDKNFAQGDIDVLEQDPTETAGPYKPRREDWDDSKNGMTEWFRSLTLNKALQKLTNLRYAVDWWQEKPECKFPIVPTLDPSLSKAWMLKPDKTSVKPFGQLYWTSAGAYFYNMTCTKCHGRLGEADGPLANNLDKWSGGNIRVANFRKGLFGHEGKNLEQFLRKGPAGETIDYSGNYFIWMALEGTKMNPPPQVADLLGANKAQMHNTIMDRCARQIPSHPKATKAYFRDFDVFEDICSFENWPSSDERLKFDLDTGKPLHPDELDTWLKKAAANAGWAIYDYVKNSLAKGVQIFPQSDCESVFGS
ncbi:MAG: hypothetical protein NTX25_17615, partial [Proteobacteria bacterium]|nr:hypothetical protein [Pseudomonadota bacterium]